MPTLRYVAPLFAAAFLSTLARAQQNPIFLHDDPDTPLRLSDPSGPGIHIGGITPAWSGDIVWKTFPREVLRRSCPDKLTVTGIELWIDDTNFVTPARFTSLYIAEGITTALGIEPDPSKVIYTSGPITAFLTPGCNCQQIAFPLGDCSTLGLPQLDADGTKDYCVVVGYMPAQTAVPLIGPCLQGDYASICTSSTDDMFAYAGPASAFSGANKTVARAPFLLPLNESVGIELEFCEPTFNLLTELNANTAETAGVHMSWTTDKFYAYRVDAQQFIGGFAFAASTVFPPLPSPGVVVPPGVCVLLNPADAAFGATMRSGVIPASGTFNSTYGTVPFSMVGNCAYSQGYVFNNIFTVGASTQLWKTCVWP